jgi:transposase
MARSFRQKGGAAVGLTKRGKGTKWMLVVDGTGTPVGFHMDSANKAEVRLAEQTLGSVGVYRVGSGRPRTRPHRLTADRAYDSRSFRHYLRKRGIRACIPPRRRPTTWRRRRGRPVMARTEEYARRWIIERTFAWLGSFRRLPIRWERHARVYRAFFTLALLLLCLRRIG